MDIFEMGLQYVQPAHVAESSLKDPKMDPGLSETAWRTGHIKWVKQ